MEGHYRRPLCRENHYSKAPHGIVSHMWYNLKHELISIDEAEALLTDGPARTIATTVIGDNEVKVSTIFLVLDHAWGGSTPMLYETMIFGGEHDSDCWRYATRDAALAGHARAVAMVNEGALGGS